MPAAQPEMGDQPVSPAGSRFVLLGADIETPNLEFDDAEELLGALIAHGQRYYPAPLTSKPSASEKAVRQMLRDLREDGCITINFDETGAYYVEIAPPKTPAEAADPEPDSEPSSETPSEEPQATGPNPARPSSGADLEPKRASEIRKWIKDLVSPFVGMSVGDVCTKSGATPFELAQLAVRGDIAIVNIGQHTSLVFPEWPTNPPMGAISSNERKLYGELRKARDPDGATRLSYQEMAALLPRQMRAKTRNMLKVLRKAKLVNVLVEHKDEGLPLTVRVVV